MFLEIYVYFVSHVYLYLDMLAMQVPVVRIYKGGGVCSWLFQVHVYFMLLQFSQNY